ncbi:MAG: L-2-hydroxyglutarate oxidase [Bacteroidetes bacterium]|nr:L-2-hydroxyglutarate oxidase [Bacteroidota bacterium]MBU1371223.1 L-2-hydroxyglutarate oxidase [Bacteroidota bacterium]MBU1483800.1 L-2-hydroxyglutarate oxidase [Bacteroidota bacterium]MBU1760050.1 L-2-hydroxyglutarate oxidase [Bacteroidota bacterium]MBU2266762.1 L-2-hydroxyglutarate oxidase [Bacteroidota bacterium]
MSLQKIGIAGGGIIGLSIAYKLQKAYPNAKILLFEKEDSLGKHQSGRNSGVLHCGLYYEPGSLKAQLAVSGIRQMTEFCRKHEVPHEICGKVVVASDKREASFLKNLLERGTANGLTGLKYLSKEELKKREPFVVAEKSLLVPEEGIVDYKAVMSKLAEQILNANGEIHLGSELTSAKENKEGIIVSDGQKEWSLDLLVSCGGLHSDRIYQKFTHKQRPLRIVPFRGEYMMLTKDAEKLVNHLIYPVPDPEYPFLGVHFTRMMTGAREVGPNAVFAFKREGYTNRQISIKDTFDAISYKGFLKFISNNLGFALGELKSSLFVTDFLKKARKLVPEIQEQDFIKGTAGVRAQAMNVEGKLLMDFDVIKDGRQVHVLNAPSPGATASLAIADFVISEYITFQN